MLFRKRLLYVSKLKVMKSYHKNCIYYIENHLNMFNVTCSDIIRIFNQGKNRLGIDWEFS